VGQILPQGVQLRKSKTGGTTKVKTEIKSSSSMAFTKCNCDCSEPFGFRNHCAPWRLENGNYLANRKSKVSIKPL